MKNLHTIKYIEPQIRRVFTKYSSFITLLSLLLGSKNTRKIRSLRFGLKKRLKKNQWLRQRQSIYLLKSYNINNSITQIKNNKKNSRKKFYSPKQILDRLLIGYADVVQNWPLKSAGFLIFTKKIKVPLFKVKKNQSTLRYNGLKWLKSVYTLRLLNDCKLQLATRKTFKVFFERLWSSQRLWRVTNTRYRRYRYTNFIRRNTYQHGARPIKRIGISLAHSLLRQRLVLPSKISLIRHYYYNFITLWKYNRWFNWESIQLAVEKQPLLLLFRANVHFSIYFLTHLIQTGKILFNLTTHPIHEFFSIKQFATLSIVAPALTTMRHLVWKFGRFKPIKWHFRRFKIPINQLKQLLLQSQRSRLQSVRISQLKFLRLYSTVPNYIEVNFKLFIIIYCTSNRCLQKSAGSQPFKYNLVNF